MQSKCVACGIKKSRFVKEQAAKGLLSNLGIKTLWVKFHCWIFCFKFIKMNEIVNTFLLAGDKFMPEMHLKQPGLTDCAVAHFLKTKGELKSL